MYVDVVRLESKLPSILGAALSKMTGLSDDNRSLVADSLGESRTQLSSRLAGITQLILGHVSEQSRGPLRQVSDIPRLFRRTNRDVPTKPCGYVALLLAPPNEFHATYRAGVEPKVLREWLTLVMSAVTEQYYGAVDDVLTSVHKTEESLRRLKKMRDRSVAGAVVNESKGVGDDDKIRQQLAIDVLCYRDGVTSLGLDKQDVAKLEELVALVESARDSKNITSISK